MNKIVYLFDEITGAFLAEIAVRESPEEPGKYLEPTFSTPIKLPVEKEGKTRHFDGKKWIYKDTPAVPDDAAIPADRRTQIVMELTRIDIESVRTARAIALAMVTGVEPDAVDIDMLALHESRALALRDELALLNE